MGGGRRRRKKIEWRKSRKEEVMVVEEEVRKIQMVKNRKDVKNRGGGFNCTGGRIDFLLCMPWSSLPVYR